ncbi:hypothetical protein HDU85_006858 [Gaertneriomyces sp. JEL0708]|nr:hypothetical protein HDU85_006858 [Gaertneriomyces sp. JEL0708]
MSTTVEGNQPSNKRKLCEYSLEEIAEIHSTDENRFTTNSDIVIKLKNKLLVEGIDEIIGDPHLLIEFYRKRLAHLNDNSFGAYVGYVATFLKRCNERGELDGENMDEVIRVLQAESKEKRATAAKRRANGEPGERETKRRVTDIQFPTIKEKVLDNYETEVKRLLRQTKPLNDHEYNELLRGIILCTCTMMPNIRSMWARVKDSEFDHMKEDGIILTPGRAILIFNSNRKHQKDPYIQLIPADLLQILVKWKQFKDRRFESTTHFFVNHKGDPLDAGQAKKFKWHIQECCNKLVGKKLGISDLRRAQITDIIKNHGNNPPYINKIYPDFHHTRAEFDKYYRSIGVNEVDTDGWFAADE